VNQVLKDHKDLWDQLDLPDMLDLKDFKDLLDLLDLLVEMEKTEPLDALARWDLPDLPDNKVFEDLLEPLMLPCFEKYLDRSCSTTTPWSATFKQRRNVPKDAHYSVEGVPLWVSQHTIPPSYWRLPI
jgi:hypothetical protein